MSISKLAGKADKTMGTQRMTNYRWVVMAIIFGFYTMTYADRANIGVVLPYIQKEYHLSSFEAGQLASLFFIGYALTQIPAGLWYGKYGVRSLISFAMIITSIFTGLIGTASSAFFIKLYRFGLGMAEGPCPVGVTSTINNWFPPKEKGTATGIYIAATKFAPVLVPPVTVWIMLTFGWREVFYIFAAPGIMLAAAWYLFIKNQPEESRFVSPAEVAHIRETAPAAAGEIVSAGPKDFGWLDWLIRAKKIAPIATNRGVFFSWNMWAATIGYFSLVSIVYGLLTWIPSYLINAKHFSFIKMGFVAAAPWVGAVCGSFLGGLISDKLLDKRRKPLMLVSTAATACMMVALINLPGDTTIIALTLLLTGLLLNIGYSNYSAYPMGLTTKQTFPVAIGLVNSGGNLGGFFAPMIAGYLLDLFGYTAVFTYFGISALVGLAVTLTMDEPL
ncbi:MAG: MFS transporter [Negativicutes bacterium]|nr:MFS transporter [Negativicutes bacterium]